MHNAQAFIDDDGTAWLYWGSDHSWGNACRCWTVRLKSDMITFDGEVRDITPARYASSPVMLKHGDHYFLTYLGTGGDDAQIHYAVGMSPMGPFTEGVSSPVSLPDKANTAINPGHHAVFTSGGRSYILYHRNTIPFNFHAVVRQMCKDPICTAKSPLTTQENSSSPSRTDKSRLTRYGPRPFSASASFPGQRRARASRRFAFAM